MNNYVAAILCFLSLNVKLIYPAGGPRERNIFVERVVFPRVHNLWNNIRHRRSLGGSEWKIVELGDWILELESEGNLVIDPSLQAEWHEVDGNVTRADVVKCEFGSGMVRGLQTSWTAVTLCGFEINGYMNINGVGYTVRPLEANKSINAHVVSSIGAILLQLI